MALGTHHEPPASTALTPPDPDRAARPVGLSAAEPPEQTEHQDDSAHRRSTYFVHSIGGHFYGGWYTRLPDGRVEVFTRTKIRTALLGRFSIEDEARRLLEEIVRESGDALIDSEVLALTHRESHSAATGRG